MEHYPHASFLLPALWESLNTPTYEQTIWLCLNQGVLKHWARIIKRWPVDKVRPENVSFQTVMQNRLSKTTKSESPAPITKPQDPNAASSAPVEPFSEINETQQANALYSLLENRYSKAHPMPRSLRYPASSPTHYDDVVREMEEAPSRSWFGALTKRIRGSLRFS